MISKKVTQMTWGELKKLMREAHTPDDAVMVFKGNSQDPKTEKTVTRVLEQNTYGDLHYVTLGGYL